MHEQQVAIYFFQRHPEQFPANSTAENRISGENKSIACAPHERERKHVALLMFPVTICLQLSFFLFPTPLSVAHTSPCIFRVFGIKVTARLSFPCNRKDLQKFAALDDETKERSDGGSSRWGGLEGAVRRATITNSRGRDCARENVSTVKLGRAKRASSSNKVATAAIDRILPRLVGSYFEDRMRIWPL